MNPTFEYFNKIHFYIETALHYCLQAIHSIIETTLKASPFLPHIIILCITFTFNLYLIQTALTSILQQTLFCLILLSTTLILTIAFSILCIIESSWYIKAKVSVSKQPKALILVDFEPFDWAHFNPIQPLPPQEQDQPQDNWDNWD